MKTQNAKNQAADIMSITAAELAGMSDDDLGKLSAVMMDELSESIGKGRTLAEQIGLIKQLRYQIEMSDSLEPKTGEGAKLDDYAADDEITLVHAEHFFRNIHRVIYKHLCFLDAIAEIGDIFSYDETKMFKESKEHWLSSYKDELADCELNTIKLRKAS